MTRFFLIAVAIILCGCANTARYQASDWYYGGYEDKQIDSNSYQITYSGENTDSVTAQIFWLYRASELAVEKGFSSLEIVDAFPSNYYPPKFTDASYKVKCSVVNVECYAGTRTVYYFISGIVVFGNKESGFVPLKKYNSIELKRKLKPVVENTNCNTTFASHLCPFDKSILLQE